ncbi:50S ribosomal protein L4 [Methanosarcinales archaeon ex4484_138]|nr:MAG: 50S ribosomal protein L4 [Methanosarcinales archaeon ex4484_138]RLG26767.1 MAG: 50S ribosomal protein L4 [Methanosarcinales archaeon]
MEVAVFDLTGEKAREIRLPLVFMEAYRPDLIKRAVLAAQANRQQPYGPHRYAGMNTSAASWGVGRGVSRVPRLTNARRAARVPQAVGGRRAHPPKPEALRGEKVNRKERRKAIASAIAATCSEELVERRGHRFAGSLPIVVVDELESLTRTSDVLDLAMKINVHDDLMRAKNGKKVRAGKGKMRGRRYKRPKSFLIVVSEDRGIIRAGRNLPGVDTVTVQQLNAELLAPGTVAGRLVIWSESAIHRLGEVYG